MPDTKKDPTAWFMEFYRLNDKLTRIDPKFRNEEEQVIALVMTNMPEDYIILVR